MRSFAAAILAFTLKFGGAGLLLLGILDSSYLFAPWGNDLLMVALTARHRTVPYVLYYAMMSTMGSVLGCLVIDLTLRPLGAKGLEKYLPPRQLKKIHKKVGENVGRAVAVASLVPPPFPFTAFIMAAVALQYSRVRMLCIVAVTRMIRFTILGFLAMQFGQRILKWADNPVVQGLLIALIVVCIVGSVVSVVVWIKRSRPAQAMQHA